MAINETWLREGEDRRAPAHPGYRLRHIPRPARIRSLGGGVGFYIRRRLYSRRIHPPQALSVEQMRLSLSVSGYWLAVGTAYQPPWLSVETFLDAMTEAVSSFSMYDIVILVGDFNIDLLSQNDANVKKFRAFLNCMNLKQYVTGPTHFLIHTFRIPRYLEGSFNKTNS